MNKLVITTINPPSNAVKAFVKMPDWDMIVVGDRKTPESWSLSGADYLGPGDLRSSRHSLHAALPWNHYGRKMLGYLEAIAQGATVIAESDDDNLPYDGWSFPPFAGRYETTAKDLGSVNVYSLYTTQTIWPRGLPLRGVLNPRTHLTRQDLRPGQVDVGIWQALADGDPDVDAIYRLVVGTPCRFSKGEPVVLADGTFGPFNSQNTAFARAAFPLLYLPAFVTFRYTDILRGVVAQPILQAAGLHLGITGATVFQERNEHDFMRDFESEVPMYLTVEIAHEAVRSSVRASQSIEDNLLAAYAALAKAGVVGDEELRLLNAWLVDLERLG